MILESSQRNLQLSMIIFFFLAAVVRVDAQTSALWSQHGELWTSKSRLPDFSFAGYHSGNDPLPNVPVKASVKEFGAKGDGQTDDSQAFLDAIAAVSDGAVFIPAGRYRITRVLKISKSNIVLRGEGPDRTILYFPKPLLEMVGRSQAISGKDGYWCWGGGVIWCGPGGDDGIKLAKITSEAIRGDTSLTLDSTPGIVRGAMVRVCEYESSDGSLSRYLHPGHADPKSCHAGSGSRFIDFASRVKSVSGSTIRLERPLRADVRLTWRPELYSCLPKLQEIGIENFSIEFPNSVYDGHVFREKGYNGIYFDRISNSWVRNVTITDADSGILTAPLSDTSHVGRFCTFQGIRLAMHWRNLSVNGHHGIALESPHDYLVTDFKIETQFVHDLTVDDYANGNVFSKGQGVNMNFDHHRDGPFENLFTEIDVGGGSRLWDHGGDECAGPPSAARETLWNIRATSPQNYPDYPQLNIIGMTAWPTSKTDRAWIENIPLASLFPRNIYLAQLSHRLAQSGSK